MQRYEIETQDGVCPAYLFTPEGDGPWPGVLMYMDALGMRPAMQALAGRLSAAGYAVLLPDLFYRLGDYPPVDPKIVLADPEMRRVHLGRFIGVATPENAMADTKALLAFMDGRAEIADGPIGVVGYCLGGRLALTAAGTYPRKIAAAASYHGGGLATDAPSSPHLLAAKMKAKVYVAGAIEDENFDDEQKRRLEAALTDASVDHIVETYSARHGWVPRDMPVHDAAEAEHHWRTLVPLFDGVLKG